jgi:hypothetical protein
MRESLGRRLFAGATRQVDGEGEVGSELTLAVFGLSGVAAGLSRC